MIDLHLNHGNSHEGVYLRLPATPGEVGEAFSMLEELGEGKVTIFDVSCPIQNIYRYIMHTDINDKDNFTKLQKLAEAIDAMHKTERQTFSGALDAESINGLDDVLRVADHLDDYVLLPNINSDTELGRFLVDSGYKNFPEEVRPYSEALNIIGEYVNITSQDTHGDFRRFGTKCFPKQKTLGRGDYMVITGDFGGLWDNSPRENYWLDWLDAKPKKRNGTQ